MKKLFGIVAFLCLFTCAFAAVSSGQEPQQNPAIVPTHRLHLNWWKVRLEEKETQAQSQHDTVLLGDSITHYWDSVAPDLQKHYFGDVLNLGFSGDQTQDVLWRIQRLDWNKIAPKRIMLMIGTNNTGVDIKRKPEDTFAGIKAIVDYLIKQCPKTKITVLNIFPRSMNGDDPKRKVNDQINRLISALSNGNNIICKDISSLYLQSDGHTLRRDLLPDLLHPNKEGYRLWAEAVASEFMQ